MSSRQVRRRLRHTVAVSAVHWAGPHDVINAVHDLDIVVALGQSTTSMMTMGAYHYLELNVCSDLDTGAGKNLVDETWLDAKFSNHTAFDVDQAVSSYIIRSDSRHINHYQRTSGETNNHIETEKLFLFELPPARDSTSTTAIKDVYSWSYPLASTQTGLLIL